MLDSAEPDFVFGLVFAKTLVVEALRGRKKKRMMVTKHFPFIDGFQFCREGELEEVKRKAVTGAGTKPNEP